MGKKTQEKGEERERGGMVEGDEKLNGFEKEGKVGRNELGFSIASLFC